MTIFYYLWRRAVAERNALRGQLDQLLVDLAVERERSANALLLATEPCSSCEVTEGLLADAVLERDAARAVANWCEKIGWGAVRADGGEG